MPTPSFFDINPNTGGRRAQIEIRKTYENLAAGVIVLPLALLLTIGFSISALYDWTNYRSEAIISAAAATATSTGFLLYAGALLHDLRQAPKRIATAAKKDAKAAQAFLASGKIMKV